MNFKLLKRCRPAAIRWYLCFKVCTEHFHTTQLDTKGKAHYSSTTVDHEVTAITYNHKCVTFKEFLSAFSGQYCGSQMLQPIFSTHCSFIFTENSPITLYSSVKLRNGVLVYPLLYQNFGAQCASKQKLLNGVPEMCGILFNREGTFFVGFLYALFSVLPGYSFIILISKTYQVIYMVCAMWLPWKRILHCTFWLSIC